MFAEDCQKVKVMVKPCDEGFELTTGDLKSACSRTIDAADRSLQQFLELLLSQEVFMASDRFVSYGSGQTYLMDPYASGFDERDLPPLPDGKYIGIGLSKGVKMIEGPSGTGHVNLAMVMDLKKAAFHYDQQKLTDKVAAILKTDPTHLVVPDNSLLLLQKALRGLYVRCTYGNFRTFQITKLIKNDGAQRVKTNVAGEAMTVEKYFEAKYNIHICFPRLPLIVERCLKGSNYYPMEVLVVCENQRVKQSQQSSQQVQAMIKACATPPFARLSQTKELVKEIGFETQRNPWLKEFGYETTKNLSIEGRILPPPTIQYGRGAVVLVNKEKTSWIAGRNHYLVPARCGSWFAAALVALNERYFNEQKFRAYIDAFVRQCHQRGMNIGTPTAVEYRKGARMDDVDRIVKQAKVKGCTFVHFVTSESFKFHDRMKLVEVKEQVVTQDLLTRTAEGAPQKWQTLDNIVNKTNLKLGGLNFDIVLESPQAQKWLSADDRLIIGFDISHPPPSAVREQKSNAPSIIGYSSNCLRIPLQFVGGYRYARAEKEEITDQSMHDIVVESMTKFKESRGVIPKHIVILRDGISEGQYRYVRENEVEQVKRACASTGGSKYHPHITFLVATKMHNMRIYKQNIDRRGKPSEQNVKPGLVVDECVVNPIYNEFYLNSHSAFQGTTKTPRYTILFDTSDMSADEVEGIVYALSYNIQIVNAAVSLPAPIMIADRMATRGRNNITAAFGESSGTDTGSFPDLAELNEQLGYYGKPLSNVRFNA
ncbi:hypothetical protein AB6A40_005900 [Gnathostoma spinigerum]|uniref:Uncharacterized protein n=1 Tax=Gnathostoma spinigerum TaxID=75299 RepID=A0ABD6EHJ3_9BILA